MGCNRKSCNPRSFLIVINVLFLIPLAGLVSFGIWTLNEDTSLETPDMDSNFARYRGFYGIASMAFGIFSIVVHCIGLWGACIGITGMLKLYAGILIAAVVGGLIHAVSGLLCLNMKSVTQLEPLFTNNTQDHEALTSMHSLQKMFECCGYNGPKDVQGSDGYPWSCCGPKNETCNVPKYDEGCLEKIKKILTPFFTSEAIIKLLVTVAVCVVYGFCIFAALRLASTLSKNGGRNIPFEQFS